MRVGWLGSVMRPGSRFVSVSATGCTPQRSGTDVPDQVDLRHTREPVLELENNGASCAAKGVFTVRSRTTGTTRVAFDSGDGLGTGVHQVYLPGFPVQDVYVRGGRICLDVEAVTFEATVTDVYGTSRYKGSWTPINSEFLNGHLVRRFGRLYNIAMFEHAKAELHIVLQWALLAFPEIPSWHKGRTLRWDSPLRRGVMRALTSKLGLDMVFWWLHLRGQLKFDQNAMVVRDWTWPARIRAALGIDAIDPFAARP